MSKGTVISTSRFEHQTHCINANIQRRTYEDALLFPFGVLGSFCQVSSKGRPAYADSSSTIRCGIGGHSGIPHCRSWTGCERNDWNAPIKGPSIRFHVNMPDRSPKANKTPWSGPLLIAKWHS